MSVDAPKEYIISNDDISKILVLETSSLLSAGMSIDDNFGSTSSSLKIISLISYFGRLDSLWALSNANIEKNKFSALARFEADLYLCAARGCPSSECEASFDGISGHWVMDGDQSELVSHIADADINSIVIITKYLCMWGHSAAALEVIKGLNPNTADCVLTHLLSVATLFGKGIARFPTGELLERWHSFFKCMSEILSFFSKRSLFHLNQSYIYFLSSAGHHSSAHSLVKEYHTKSPQLYSFVQMQKALNDSKVSKAIVFADRLIILKKVTSDFIGQFSPFDRNVAEEALCEVNNLLRSAGVDAFIISGTLLGCIRDGRIFEHDKDFDLGVIGWEKQFDVAQALLSSSNFSFSAKGLKGHELFLLAVIHVPSGYAFDIFFFHDVGGKFKHGIQSRLGYTLHYLFSKFDLAEKDFLGHKFLIPKNYELFLDENYGKEWRSPDPDYFVKLESPALASKSGDDFAFSIRHEMLVMLGNRAKPSKGRIFIEKMKLHAQPKDQPKPAVVNAFLKKLKDWDETKALK